MGSVHEKGVQGCARLPRCCLHTWHSGTERFRPLLVGLVWVVWMIVPFLGAIQFKYRLIRSLRDIFEDILDIVDAVTYFNIVMEIELTQQE